VSSTYYDLKHIRKNIETFIEEMGYEAVLFESGDIPYKHNEPMDSSCFQEIENAHMQVLILGGRYGDPTTQDKSKRIRNDAYEKYNSITKEEFNQAKRRKIPVFIFVEKNVLAEYETYKKNRGNDSITYAHVDNISIFELIEEIITSDPGAYIKAFENSEDIIQWLKDQWAGLFADYLSNATNSTEITTLSDQITELKGVTDSIKRYAELIVVEQNEKEGSKIVREEEKKIKSIQERRFTNKLMEHSMMHFLISHYSIQPTRIRLVTALKNSKKLEEFLREIGMKKDEIEDFIKNYETPGTRDFNQLKKEYEEIHNN